MAYTHNFDISIDNMEKQEKQKVSIPIISSIHHKTEPAPASLYCRRHVSKTRRNLKGKTLLANAADDNEGNDPVTCSKCKSRRHLHKEIDRLVQENQKLVARLQEASSVAVTIDEQRKREQSLKYHDKYKKLEKDYGNVLQECEGLNILLKQREIEYKQLHTLYEELTQVLQTVEKAKNNLYTKNQQHESDSSQLNEDIVLLKNVVYRLNQELERYQDKLRAVGQTAVLRNTSCTIEATKEDQTVLQSWGRVNTHVLGPLLDAYQESITEKECLINNYEQEVTDLSSRCKNIVEENESLQADIESLKLKCDRYVEEIKIISEDAALVKEQNDLLNKQTIHQRRKLQELQSVYEQKVDSMSQDNNKLHKDFLICKTELSNILGKYEVLTEGYTKLKNDNERSVPLSVHTAAVEECKRLFEELKFQYDTQNKKLTSQVKHLQETTPNNEIELANITAERNQLKVLTKNLEKSLKVTQTKLETMRNSMHAMQLSRDSFKRRLSNSMLCCKKLISEYEQAITEKEKLTAILYEREKDEVHIHYLGDSIANHVSNLKTQLMSVQKGAKEQLSSIEKRIKTQEVGVHQMKSEYRRELQRLKHLVKQKEEIIGRLQKERLMTQDNLNLVWTTAATNEKKVQEALKKTNPTNV